MLTTNVVLRQTSRAFRGAHRSRPRRCPPQPETLYVPVSPTVSLLQFPRSLTVLTQPIDSPPDAQPQPEDAPLQPAAVLIRASNGKSKEHRAKGEKIKISTIVEPDQLDGFYTRYAEVCRGGMTGLKPRDRKKASAKKKKKKGGAASVAA